MRYDSGLYNCIIRGYGKRVFAQAFNYWGENNDTFVKNCDISDGVQTPLQYGDGAAWDDTKRQNTYIANNHIHHNGYRIADDIAGIFFGSHPTGNVMDHNCIHDVTVHNYCGQGIASDTGSNGAVVKNNLVYDVEDCCWGMNGMHHQCFNNIFAFSENKIGFGEINPAEEIMTAHHNICYNGPNDKDFLTGAYNDNLKIQIYNNLYYSEVDDYKFYGLTKEEWIAKGRDHGSIIGQNPKFKDPAKRDFTLTDLDFVKSFGFEPFSMEFGVIGEEWRKVAENYEYPEPMVTLPRVPITGKESFERGMKTHLCYRMDSNSKNELVRITDEKAATGKHSLLIEKPIGTGDTDMQFYLGFLSGHAEVSFKIWIAKGTQLCISFWTGPWLDLKDKEISYGMFNVIGSYEEEKWIEVKVEGDYNTTERQFPKFLNLTLGDVKYDLEDYNDGHPLEFMRIWVYEHGKYGKVYVDDLNFQIDSPEAPFFTNQALVEKGKSKSESKSKSSKAGLIVGVVIGVLVVIAAVVLIVIFVVIPRMKAKVTTSDQIELNV